MVEPAHIWASNANILEDDPGRELNIASTEIHVYCKAHDMGTPEEGNMRGLYAGDRIVLPMKP